MPLIRCRAFPALSLLIACSFFNLACGEPPAQLKNASEFWAKVAPLIEAHNVSMGRWVDRKLLQTETYATRNGHALITQAQNGIIGEVRFFLANPKYAATVDQKGAVKQVKWIGLDDAALKKPYANLFVMQIGNPLGLKTILVNQPALAKDLKLIENGEGYGYVVAKELPEDAGIHPEYAGAEVRVYGATDAFPERCEIMYRDGKNRRIKGSRFEFRAFVQVKGVKIPSVVVASQISKFGGDSENASEFRYDYKKIDQPLPKESCYLAKYGLKEPVNKPDLKPPVVDEATSPRVGNADRKDENPTRKRTQLKTRRVSEDNRKPDA